MKRITAFLIMLLVLSSTFLTIKQCYATTYTLTIPSISGGYTTPSAGVHTYSESDNVEVDVFPYYGYAFWKWMIDGTPHYSTPLSFSMNMNRIAEPVFNFTGGSNPSGWQQTESSGNWTIGTRTSWKAISGEVLGNLAYTNTVWNFTGYYAKINLTELEVIRPHWYDFGAEKNLYWTMEITSGNSSILIYVRFKSWITWWGGTMGSPTVFSSIRANDTNIFSDANSISDTHSEPKYLEVLIWKNGTNLNGKILNTYYMGLWEQNDLGEMERILYEYVNMDVNVSFPLNADFFNCVNLTQRFLNSGDGYFTGNMTDVTYFDTPYNPSIPSEVIDITIPVNPLDAFLYGLRQGILNMFPESLRSGIATIGEWAATLGRWLSWLVGFVGGIIYTIVTTVAPFLPFILLCWFLDVIYTALSTGSISPIGTLVTTCYDFIVSVISTIVGIISTLYDFIHFW